MSAPRLEIDLNKVFYNAKTLVTRLNDRGISVTGVTKVALGSVEIANVLLQAGVISLGDSRISNIKSMRVSKSHLLMQQATTMLIRSPMLSQVAEVLEYADISCNTEIDVIKKLSDAAYRRGYNHHIVLMVELGDLREGIMPKDLTETVRAVLALPNIILKGIGANLACRSGVSPDPVNMMTLSQLAEDIETEFNLTLEIVSGGNSANLTWALDRQNETGRINHLRLGESIFLGCETLDRKPITGLYTDAIQLIAEVIEAKVKPSKPTGNIAQTAFGKVLPMVDRGNVSQAILAVGIQDVDTDGLRAVMGIEVTGASSDHLIVESAHGTLRVGEEIAFQVDYSALVRSMTSPFVSKKYLPCRHF